MKDDYLWDGTGEPDREIEQLEELLGRFRHQAKAPEMPTGTRRFFWSRMAAAAAAVIIAVLGGLWVVLNLDNNTTSDNQQAVNERQKDHANTTTVRPVEPENKSAETTNATPSNPPGRKTAGTRHHIKRAVPNRVVEETPSFSSTVAMVNFETANYLESAQMLLRSFRNINSEESGEGLDISYEKERSRELLYKNILLRRDAEAKGNLPVGDLLSSVEPILLEIANLPADPAKSDVRGIQERIEKKEIIATIQVYSAPMLGANFKLR